jgi:hypothetical protein
MQLKARTLILLDAKGFKRAEKLALRHKDKELRQFLIHQGEKLKLRGILPKLVAEEVKYWLREFFKRGGPGRPYGTGHPKAKLPTFGFSPHALATLKHALSEADMKLLFAVIRTGSQKGAAKELRVTPQAVNKRWKKRIYPALLRVNPHFTLMQFRSAVANHASK